MGKSSNAGAANSLAEAKCQTDFLVVRIKDGLATKCLFSTASTLAIITDISDITSLMLFIVYCSIPQNLVDNSDNSKIQKGSDY